ncbi:MAG: hypothetical protein K2Q23_01145 [Bryobacteraceae bacterium]|nr:hypothetical protein [Bryobacteraceae bacterium]
MSQRGETILIPTPSLAELFVKLDPLKIDELLKRLKTSAWFRVEAFDTAAAVELGTRTAAAIARRDKREGLKADHAKVKFDRQIAAIAVVHQVERLVSDDAEVAAIGDRWGLPVVSVASLPLPPELIPPPLFAGLDEK